MSHVSHDCDHEASDGAMIVMTNMYDKRRLVLTPVSSSEPDVHWAEIGKKKVLQYYHQSSQQLLFLDVMSIDLAPGPNLNTFISGVSRL